MDLDPDIVAAVKRAVADTRSHDVMIDQPWLTDRRVFRFCQYLRSAVGADTPARELIAYLRLWFDSVEDVLAEDEDYNGDRLELTWEYVRGQFAGIWANAEIYPVGDFWGGMMRLYEPDIAAVNRYEDEGLRRLVSAMYHASQRSGDSTFYMGGADAGRIIGRSQPMGRAAILTVLADGIIRQLERGHTGHSPKYQWIAET